MTYRRTIKTSKRSCVTCDARENHDQLKSTKAKPLGSNVWPYCANFCHFGTILKVLGKFLRVYLVLGNSFTILWQKCNAIGDVSANNQNIKKISRHVRRARESRSIEIDQSQAFGQQCVAILCKFLPFWHNFKSLGQIFEGLFSTWQ